MKQGDYGTKLTFTVYDEDNVPLILEEATAKLILSLGKTRLEKQCVIEDADEGLISYILEPDDLDDDGILYMEIEITYGDDEQKYTSSRIKEKIKKKL